MCCPPFPNWERETWMRFPLALAKNLRFATYNLVGDGWCLVLSSCTPSTVCLLWFSPPFFFQTNATRFFTPPSFYLLEDGHVVDDQWNHNHILLHTPFPSQLLPKLPSLLYTKIHAHVESIIAFWIRIGCGTLEWLLYQMLPSSLEIVHNCLAQYLIQDWGVCTRR